MGGNVEGNFLFKKRKWKEIPKFQKEIENF
jgi:hypothetical protein